jgi:hypothetical protein
MTEDGGWDLVDSNWSHPTWYSLRTPHLDCCADSAWLDSLCTNAEPSTRSTCRLPRTPSTFRADSLVRHADYTSLWISRLGRVFPKRFSYNATCQDVARGFGGATTLLLAQSAGRINPYSADRRMTAREDND